MIQVIGSAGEGAFKERGARIVGIVTGRLSHLIRLTAAEAAYLDGLEARSVHYPRRRVIQTAGDPNGQAFVLKSGWVISYSQLPDGSKQIRRLHFPGDLVAMPSLAFRHHAEDLEAVTDVVVSPFPKRELGPLFERHPRLAALMFLFSQLERVSFGDRLLSVGAQPCKSRLAFLLLDILNRLRSSDPSISDTIAMPLSREQMAEITGMTPIHASRMWSELVREGAIACEGHSLTILDEPRLMDLSGWVGRFQDLDFSWLPAAPAASADPAQGPTVASIVAPTRHRQPSDERPAVTSV